MSRDPDRAACVQAIRDLAQWIEDHPEVPAPNSVHAQHSLTDSAPGNADMIRAVADALDVRPGIGDDIAMLRVELHSWPLSVTYVVHGYVDQVTA